ncbi:MAG: c-type cytochrome, partial [Spirochaetota bacterium]|nr:c-type cytochrome [Spirochaetota bacterium]
FLKGNESALTDREKNGLRLFQSVGCAGCHSGVALGGGSYHKFGAVTTIAKLTDTDKGRGAFTKNAAEDYFFKVPSLRNIERTYPYFHTGSVWTLEEAVEIMAKAQLGKDLKEGERDDIVAFLKSLTGEIPASALTLPVLPASGKATSKPEPYNMLKR